MLKLDDYWVWDSWSVTDDEGLNHLFFLKADKSLLDPDKRHYAARIGHAISRDWTSWEVVVDALRPSDHPAWDDLATWTGSVVRNPEGGWVMFYTGVARSDDGLAQRIGRAFSDDLFSWAKDENFLLEPDPRWYETLADTGWHDQAWRDPFVFQDPVGGAWHMLITARARHGHISGRGVVGYATSVDLDEWEVQAALSGPGNFGQLEVLQTTVVDGQPTLLFSCLPEHHSLGPDIARTSGGVWTARGDSLLGPWDLDNAVAVAHESLYAARLIEVKRLERPEWALLGFVDRVGPHFVGEITDPLPVAVTEGVLHLSSTDDAKVHSGRPGVLD
ncbi:MULTISPECIES: glycoside hydrolase family 68 protein [Microbacterium]|uniref:glycoside hydrolase family 68 protein n=1 Tax=Microbacterium TaxID=33882 RepID=UPI00146C4A7B|nr:MULTISPECIES: glycoside hydrolase family 68 protein [Microbacterium]